MTQAWLEAMVRACWQGALVVAAVWVLLSLWRQCRAEVRAWLWVAATTKFLLVLLFVIEVPVLAPTGAGLVETPLTTTGIVTFSSASPPAPSIDWLVIGFATWSVCVVLLALRAYSDHRGLARLVAESMDAGERVDRAWASVASPGSSVRVHPDATVPMVVGLWRPVVVLPETLEFVLSDDELAMVLAHEAAHLRRRDALVSLYMFACGLLFFFHPLVWLARREWKHSREAACDAEAIAALGTDRRRYAQMLVKVSAGADRAPALAMSAVPSFKTLQRRIKDMKNTSNKRAGSATWTLLAIVAVAAATPIALTQRKPKFGAGVFEGASPDVKVTQQRRGTESVARVLAPSSAEIAAPVATAMDSTSIAVGVPFQGTTEAIPPVAMQGSVAGVATALAPNSVATAGPRAGQATTTTLAEPVKSQGAPVAGQATTATDVRPTSGSLSGQVATVVEGRPTSGLGGTSVATGSAPTSMQGLGGSVSTSGAPTVADVTAPSGGTNLMTLVMRDSGGRDGEGLDKLVNLDVKGMGVAELFRALSRQTGMSITVRNVRTSVRVNAELKGVTLGEVMGTLSRSLGLEWRIERDGITVQPFRG